MCLTIQSNKPINEIEKLVKECFSDIKSKSKIEFSSMHPLVPVKKYKHYNKEYQLQTVRNIDSIVYFWELPDFNEFKDNKIIDVITNTINLNCKNNLENMLIETKLVSNIDIFYLDIGILVLSVDIIHNINIKYAFNKINDMIRYYFNNLKTNSKNINWNDIYNYYIKSYELLYNNKVKENNMDLATNISNNMHYFDEPNIYNGNKIVIKKDYNLLNKILELICFDKVNIIYNTNKKLGSKYKKDKYYDKLYCRLDKSFIPDKQNEYSFNIVINNDLLNLKPKIIKHLDKYNEPQKIAKRFWYGGVSKFNEPIVIGHIIINSNKFFYNVRELLTTIISITVINYYLQLQYCNEIDIGYNADISIINGLGILMINIIGFNDKYIEFFNKVLENLKNIELSDSIIENHIEQCNKDIENINKWSPWELTSHMLSSMMNKYYYYYKDELKEIKNITINIIKNRINNIINFKNIPITTIIYGNIKLSSKELKQFYSYNKNLNIEIDKIPKQKLPHDITIKHPNKDELNCCISFIFSYIGNSSLLSAKLLILNTLMERPAFDELRTKHQLGYLVACKLKLDDISYIKLSVQSTENTKKVEGLMNEFIFNTMKDILDNMNEKEFKQIKQSIYDNLIDKDNNLLDMSSHYINEIIKQEYIFDRKQQVANKIKDISLNDIKELYHSIIKKKTIILII
jgi:secreted Zn-dependent insulinase-like peptidase